jgi:hypothetical protein
LLHFYLGKKLEVAQAAAIRSDVVAVVVNKSAATGEFIDIPQTGASQWRVVAICADSGTLEDARSYEVAVVPRKRFSKEIQSDMVNGIFYNSIRCNDGRGLRG